ncbi:Ryncolin-4 [Mizuhopecten yessoensis]|uniref:Ryncolin-4 n=1 Tax=Mizuhopecten yessoensis TaxID=6573 RepID=A0A210QUA6_MIZYE|nr:Ryncolin-4 [Mizuhopecten yessoensis]
MKRIDITDVLRSCSDLGSDSPSGVYQLTLTSGESFKVYCDMRAVDGPWTVIQNRYDGSEYFYREWDEYKKGFGDLNGEFWIGNDIIHTLTQTASVLRIELEGFPYKKGFAEYSMFKVTDESDGYKMTLTASTRNVSRDAMLYHSGKKFSAKDKGANVNCAISSKSGWWYGKCHQANLNGKYTKNYWASNSETLTTWWYFPGPGKKMSLRKTRMMIRPAHV